MDSVGDSDTDSFSQSHTNRFLESRSLVSFVKTVVRKELFSPLKRMSYYQWSGYPYSGIMYPSECSCSHGDRKILRDCCFSPLVSMWNYASSTVSNAYEATYQWLTETDPKTKNKPEEHMLQEFP